MYVACLGTHRGICYNMPTILLPCQDKIVYIQIKLRILHSPLALLPVGHSYYPISDLYTLFYTLFYALFYSMFLALKYSKFSGRLSDHALNFEISQSESQILAIWIS